VLNVEDPDQHGGLFEKARYALDEQVPPSHPSRQTEPQVRI